MAENTLPPPVGDAIEAGREVCNAASLGIHYVRALAQAVESSLTETGSRAEMLMSKTFADYVKAEVNQARTLIHMILDQVATVGEEIETAEKVLYSRALAA